jgi:16S rRNA (uracil1498-N3)-methyltransferase
MRLHRFYIPDTLSGQSLVAGKVISIKSADLVNQIRRVFRLKNGDHVILFDRSGFDFECELATSEYGKDSITLRIISSERSHYLPKLKVNLYAAVTKKDTFEWIVQKATELGVTKIIPVLAERSEKKALNMSRLEKIAIEASEQSGRGDVPKILPIIKLDEVVNSINGAATQASDSDSAVNKTIVFHTEGEIFSPAEFIDDNGGQINVLIGPEGGWSPDEIDMFHKNKIAVRSLGKQILRAETAVVVALSMAVFPN